MDIHDLKRLALIKAIEAEMNGMITENNKREFENKSMAYTYEDFNDIAQRFIEMARAPNEDLY